MSKNSNGFTTIFLDTLLITFTSYNGAVTCEN